MHADIKVMLVEDDDLFSGYLKELISRDSGLEIVAIANNGLESEKIAIKVKPDVILMDIVMPEMNGVEAASRIKKHLPDTVIIALSGYFKKEYIDNIIKAGANGYILKTSKKEEIVSAIKTAYYGGCVFDKDILESVFKLRNNKNTKNKIKKFTIRELEIIQLCEQGNINKEIALKLNLSERTVHSHWRNIFYKLEVNTRLEAVIYCIKNNLIDV